MTHYRVGRWQLKWTVERWNRRASLWDVIETFPTNQEANTYLNTIAVKGDTLCGCDKCGEPE